jgi:hypothetical protein
MSSRMGPVERRQKSRADEMTSTPIKPETTQAVNLNTRLFEFGTLLFIQTEYSGMILRLSNHQRAVRQVTV